jgi:hypothetical protein
MNKKNQTQANYAASIRYNMCVKKIDRQVRRQRDGTMARSYGTTSVDPVNRGLLDHDLIPFYF